MTIEDEENASDALMELIEHHENLKRFESKKTVVNHGNCPRCTARVMISSGFAYCPDCNWDSVN